MSANGWPVSTIDVSRPPAAGALMRAAGVLGDLVLTLLLVLMLPVVLVVGAPLVFLAWVIVVIAQHDRGSHA